MAFDFAEGARKYGEFRKMGYSEKDSYKLAGYPSDVLKKYGIDTKPKEDRGGWRPSVNLMGTGGHDSLQKLNQFHNDNTSILVEKDSSSPLGFRVVGKSTNQSRPTDFITVGEGEGRHVIPVSYLRR